MLNDIFVYLNAHPRLVAALALGAVFAVVGVWYVVAHHLKVILITLLSGAGIAAGGVVLYRGLETNLLDLIGIGLFLLVIFPIIFLSAIKISRVQLSSSVKKTPSQPSPRSAA